MLLKIFPDSLQLSSLKIDASHLVSMMYGTLTHYLRKPIKKLHLNRKSTKLKIMSVMIENCYIFLLIVMEIYGYY